MKWESQKPIKVLVLLGCSLHLPVDFELCSAFRTAAVRGAQDLFAHVTALVEGDASIQEGDKVTYDKDW